MDFPNKILTIYTDGQKCLDLNLNQNEFQLEKLGFSFTGFSSWRSPIQIKLHELSILKQVKPELKYGPNFDFDTYYLRDSVNHYDKLHKDQSSISNLLLLEGRTEHMIDNIQEMSEMMAYRTQDIQNVMDEWKDEGNMFFDQEEKKTKMEEYVKKLEQLLNFNNNMESKFSEISGGFEKVESLLALNENLKELEEMVSVFDNMLEIDDFKSSLSFLTVAGNELKTSHLREYARHVI